MRKMQAKGDGGGGKPAKSMVFQLDLGKNSNSVILHLRYLCLDLYAYTLALLCLDRSGRLLIHCKKPFTLPERDGSEYIRRVLKLTETPVRYYPTETDNGQEDWEDGFTYIGSEALSVEFFTDNRIPFVFSIGVPCEDDLTEKTIEFSPNVKQLTIDQLTRDFNPITTNRLLV